MTLPEKIKVIFPQESFLSIPLQLKEKGFDISGIYADFEYEEKSNSGPNMYLPPISLTSSTSTEEEFSGFNTEENLTDDGDDDDLDLDPRMFELEGKKDEDEVLGGGGKKTIRVYLDPNINFFMAESFDPSKLENYRAETGGRMKRIRKTHKYNKTRKYKKTYKKPYKTTRKYKKTRKPNKTHKKRSI